MPFLWMGRFPDATDLIEESRYLIQDLVAVGELLDQGIGQLALVEDGMFVVPEEVDRQRSQTLAELSMLLGRHVHD